MPVERGGRLALSFAQQRLWFLEQLGSWGAPTTSRMRLRLRGALDRAALARTLERIVARHESLRTVFVRVDGEPEQRILPVEESGFALVEHDLRGLAARRGEAAPPGGGRGGRALRPGAGAAVPRAPGPAGG